MMNNQRERLKTLSAVMLRWAEDNKMRREVVEGIAGDYVIPQRNGIDWREAFKYITGLDIKLDMKYATALTKEEMYKCNKYYKEYR
jgi:hypothetical protein